VGSIREWLCLLGIGLVSTAASPQHLSTRSVGHRPSIILIVLDAARADHLSAMGYARPTTPNLDRLAAGGLLFTQHYSATNGTIMGVSQLLMSTLRPRPLIAAPDGPELSSDNALGSLPSVFSGAGYRTALFAGHPYFHPRLASVTRTFDHYSNIASFKAEGEKANLDDVLFDFEPWLATQQTPFFAYLHAMDTHFPHPPRTPRPLFVNRRIHPSFANGSPPEQAVHLKNAAERQYVVDLYDEDLHEADRAIGHLLDTLGRLGRLESTVVVVTADHGEQLYETGYAGHGGGIGNLPDTETHIPLIISFGRQVRPERIDGITRSVDVAPSLLALAGLPIPPWMMGNPLVRSEGAGLAFDPHSASPFAPIFNQDRDPVRVALRFPHMKFFTRWATDPSIEVSADDTLVTVGDAASVVPITDSRWSEAQTAWRRLTDLLRRPTRATDDTVRQLLQRLRTLGYIHG
jgi:arylsulfatase A-like enzyme